MPLVEAYPGSGLEKGTQVGVWVVERRLGKGGIGAVYRCHNRHTSRIVAAIKLLDPAIMHHSEVKARFVREAEILFTLDHPNIVKVSSVYLDSFPPYIEMEFVEGRSLENELAMGGALPLETALALGEQLLSALVYLHGKGVCHRDIKPANLLIRVDGLLKLVDFGLAVEESGERITHANTAFGTVSYAPPEWLTPKELDPQSWDLYASGIVLFEMLTGEVAFPMPGGMDRRRQAVQVMAAKQLRQNLDPGARYHDDLRSLVRSMTARDPADRPRSAKDALSALRSSVRGYRDAGAVVHKPAQIDPNQLYEAMNSITSPVVGADGSEEPPLLELDEPEFEPPRRGAVSQGRETPALGFDPPHPRHARPLDPSSIPIDDPSLDGVDPVPVDAEGGAGGGYLSLALGAGLVGMLAVASLAIGAVFLVQRTDFLDRTLGPPASTTERDVDLVVTGIPDDVEIGLRLAGKSPSSAEGHTVRFEKIPLGKVELLLAIGNGCATETCPGVSCPEWCAQGSLEREIPRGRGAFTYLLETEAPPPREVVLVAKKAPPGEPLAVRLDGKEGSFRAGEARFQAVHLGRHALVAEIGSCPASAEGCSSSGDRCPTGCGSWASELIVPTGTDAFRHEIAFSATALPSRTPPPETPPSDATTSEPPSSDAAPSEGTTVVPALPEPLPAPEAPPAGDLVTGQRFSAWLATEPAWSREKAIAAGKADDAYLDEWVDGRPPGTGFPPVSNVSWWAANAYCKERGGLARIDAAPLTWSLATGGPAQEWRMDEGSPAIRRSDGSISTSFSPTESNGWTSFRCAL